MEAGLMNLKQLSSIYGPIRGKNLKKLIKAMTVSLLTIHDRGYCWTDCKLDNYVIFSGNSFNLDALMSVSSLWKNELIDYTSSSSRRSISKEIIQCFLDEGVVKAIDVESIIKVDTTMGDFSPEVLAPEHAIALSQGQLSLLRDNDFKLSLDPDIIPKLSLFEFDYKHILSNHIILIS